MRAFIQSADLAAALKSSVASANSPMDALRCAHLFTERDAVVLETTDTITFTRTRIPARVDDTGAILFNTQTLAPIAAGQGEILLRSSGEIQRGRSRYRLAPIAADAWPGQERADWQRLALDPAGLRGAIESVASAAADDGEPRAYLRGVHLVPGMVWCADGVHIATARVAYDGPAVVLPAQPVRGLLEVLQEGATVEVEAAGRQARRLRVTSGHRQSTVRLLDTSPIDIAGLIARTRSQAPGITVRRTELAAAIRRFMPFAMVPGETPKKALPTLILQLQGGELSLADRAEESVESLEGALVAGEGKWRAGLNPRQLLDALSAIGGEVVQVEPPAANPEDRSYQGVWRLYPAGAAPEDLAHYVAPITL